MAEKSCNNCNVPEAYQYDESKTIPYVVYQSSEARHERRERRLWIAFIVAIILWFANNIGWLIYESMYDTYSYDQDGGGINNVNLGEQGALYGTEGENKTQEKPN